MEDSFPVNAGNIPIPPSQSTTISPHQINMASYQHLPPTTTMHTISGPGKRRRQKDAPRSSSNLKLERIIGLTTASSNILASAESQDLIAYAAGAVIVLYNHKRNKQVGFLYRPSENTTCNSAASSAGSNSNPNSNNNTATTLISPLGSSGQGDMLTCALPTPRENQDKRSTPASNRVKPISCLAFSPDGLYLAAGEMGHQPRILIWNVKERLLMHQCRAHKFGILSVAFSPNMRYLVSVGFQHDGYLYVWNWRKGVKLASNKVTSKVNALSFSKDGSYFVTAGLRHVKYWYLDARGRIPKRGNLSSRETQVLDGRSGILGALRDCNFVDVACDKLNSEHVYFITDTGILCVFKENRGIDKWVNLQVSNAYSITVSSTYIICSSSHGIVRLFEPVTLKYYGILPKPHPLGVDISTISSPHMLSQQADQHIHYPDAVALTHDESTAKVTVVYSDRSLYIWDIKNLTKIGKYRSFIAHSDCVWGIEPYPIDNQYHAHDARLSPASKTELPIPQNSFVTFSADGTVRFWNLDYTQPSHSCSSSSPVTSPSSVSSFESSTSLSMTSSPSSDSITQSISTTSLSSFARRNIYSRELIKMLYVDSDAAEFSKLRRDVDISEDQCPDFGIRSLKINSTGKLMATGDRNGNLRVHNMESWEQITYQEAHDSEILSIDISDPTASKGGPLLIATASRDRLLHIFDAEQDFKLVQSLDDHSSSITAVRFTKNAEKLISCGADKGLIFRQCSIDKTTMPIANTTNMADNNASNAFPMYINYHNHSGRSTVFDMSLDVTNRFVATVTGERRLFVFNVESGKPFRMCKPETPEEIASGASTENSGGSLINIDLDPLSGTFAVTSGSDRCLRLFDLVSGVCVEKVCAHAELITSVKFVRAPKETLRVISTCSDGTIFVWSVDKELVTKMKARSVDPGTKASARLKDDANGSSITHPPPRLRRVSAASSIRPTPTLSQMIRQGDRKTFSTMSTAEHKYDDIYKRMMTTRKQRDPTVHSNITIPTPQANTQGNSNTVSPPYSEPPASPASASPTNIHRYNALINKNTATSPKYKEQQQQQQQQQQISPHERKSTDGFPQGKLERLYNGIPTTGARDRTTNIVNQRHHPPPLGPMMGQRMNPVLRKQMSRDALVKKDHHKTRPRSTNDTSPRRYPPNGSIIADDARRASDSGILPSGTSAAVEHDEGCRDTYDELSGSARDSKLAAAAAAAAAITTPTAPTHAAFEGGDRTKDTKIAVTVVDNGGNENDNDVDDNNSYSGGDNDNDDDDDDDEEVEEEEEIIFITAPQNLDDIGKPIEVSADDIASASSSSSSRGDAGSGWKSPISDNETTEGDQDDEEQHTNSEEEDSEENTDEAMINGITAREAPRMTTSLSRTTSSTMNISRKKLDDRLSLEYQKLQQQHTHSSPALTPRIMSPTEAHRQEALSALCSPNSFISNSSSKDTDDTATSTTDSNASSPLKSDKDTAALHKLHKKLEKSKKRTSFTARFLSSLSDKKGQYRESLDNVLNTFKDLSKSNHSNSNSNNDRSNNINDSLMIIPAISPITSSNSPSSPGSDGTPSLISPSAPKGLPPLPPSRTSLSPTDHCHQQPQPKPRLQLQLPCQPEVPEVPRYTSEANVTDADAVDAESMISDLDGAKILLDSVLTTYSIMLKKSASSTDRQDNSSSALLVQVEKKLRNMAQSMNQILGECPPQKTLKQQEHEQHEQQDPATLALLDKYSSLLVSMVESKLHA